MFCLPFAGGGASTFLAWRTAFPAVGIAPIQYPGHETRLAEAPMASLASLVTGLAAALRPQLDRPYILFGYSMGAKIAYALARHMAREGWSQPEAVFVAAHVPPDRASRAAQALALPDARFKDVLRAYGGMPEDLLQDEGFCSLMLPILRADFAMAVQAVDLEPLDCPVFAYAGAQDETASASVMAGWRRFTRGRFQQREFPGGHFFYRDAAGFRSAITADLSTVLGSNDRCPSIEPAASTA
jgi:surfactin synthase thioesterase subunit